MSVQQRVIRLGLAGLASAASLALSWPYWRDYGYWAESQAMWRAYFAIGFALAVYVLIVFLRSLATLFEHDALQRRQAAPAGSTSSSTAGEEARP